MRIRENISKEDGFAFTAICFAISIIMGLFIAYFSNSISHTSLRTGNKYSNMQANWSAVAGIETAISYMVLGDVTFPGTYNYANGSFTLDTLTTDVVNNIFTVTSTGRYDNSIKVLEVSFQYSAGGSYYSEDFSDPDDEDYEYEPEGAGPGHGRFWGLSCGNAWVAHGITPHWILQGSDGCYFYGSKIKNNSELEFEEIEVDEAGEYILKFSLASGKDVSNFWKQRKMQNGDYVELIVNDVLIERWQGTSSTGESLVPTIGNTTQVVNQNFEEFSFNLTSILGTFDEVEIEFEAKTNNKRKYVGIDGLDLMGAGGYSILPGTYKTI